MDEIPGASNEKERPKSEGKLRILFVQPANTIGGAELSLWILAKYLHQKGHSLYFVLPPSSERTYFNMLSEVAKEVHEIPLMPWAKNTAMLSRGKKWINYIFRSFKSGGWHIAPALKIRKIITSRKIDIVHTNTTTNIDGALAAKLAGRPHVQHIRELIGDHENAIVQYPFQRSKTLFSKMMKQLHTFVIANSGYTENVARPYFSRNRIKTIYNPMEFDDRSSGANKANSVKNVGLVANVTSRVKNHRLFIEVARSFVDKYPNIELKFSIYGNLPGDNDPYFLGLLDLIRELKLERIVEFKGRYDDIFEMYEKIDILVHTFSGEAFGRIFLEAMSFGVPVIAARGGGAMELLGENERGLVVKDGDAEGFAEAIYRLLDHEEVRNDFISKGRKFSERFDICHIGEEIIQEYRMILNGDDL